jgi:LmbE family N-acetylglucosaminyl deacetylase
VVAPHPDDETLGTGGLIAAQRRRGIDVLVIAVTDGEAAHEGVQGLGPIRQAEQERALERLGVGTNSIIRLALPDSGLGPLEDELVQLIKPMVDDETLIVAPSQFDFHPDHEVCGRASRRVALELGAAMISYPFWTWHRGRVEHLTAESLRRFDLDEQLQRGKRAALAEHRSQLVRESGSAVLPESLLGPARRDFETFIIHN